MEKLTQVLKPDSNLRNEAETWPTNEWKRKCNYTPAYKRG